MKGKAFMGDEEVKFMQLAWLDDENHKPHRSEFRSLWNGHWKKVTMKMPIYLSASRQAGVQDNYGLDIAAASEHAYMPNSTLIMKLDGL